MDVLIKKLLLNLFNKYMNEKGNIINPDDLEKNETTEEIKAHDLTADEKSEAEAYFSEHIKSLIDVKNVEAARNRFANNIEKVMGAGTTLSEAIEVSEKNIISDYKEGAAYTGSHEFCQVPIF